jgi:DsbC/DsbD-like thiol-disulfide interchange protein
MRCTPPHPFILVTAAALICLTGARVAQAQDASDWDVESHAAARLIAGSKIKTGNATWLHAGIEIKLESGWKTYWRMPGDSGVPPTLDFSGSDNVKSVTVEWPAPEKFPDGAGGHSIGYVGRIILPLHVAPKDATKEAALRLKLGYAICKNLCVPGEANLELMLSGNGTEETVLEQEELHVPRRVALGAGGGLSIRSIRRQDGGEHGRIVVEVGAPEGAPVDLFVEGPTPDWSLPLPEQIDATGDMRRFMLDIDGLPPGAHIEGAMLTITAVSGSDAIEVATHLD